MKYPIKICWDAGHGGHDTGAIGPTSLRESLVTLSLANRGHILAMAAGLTSMLTRERDDFISLDQRASIANAAGADLFVSIHCNAVGNPAPNGYEVWTTPGQTQADPLAEAIFRSIKAQFPREIGRADLQDGDHDREANFAVLRLTKAPAALAETGFISHPETEDLMRQDAWLDLMAHAIVGGVMAYLDGLDS